MKQAGFTLLELLLVLLLTTICASIIFKLFIYYSEQSRYLTAYADLLSKARYLRIQLTSKIELAGFAGCGQLTNHSIEYLGVKPNSFNLQSVFKIEKNQYGPVLYIKNIDPQISFLTDKTARLLTIMGKSPKYKAGDELLVTDCQHLAIAQATHVSMLASKQGQRLTLLTNLPASYAKDSMVGLVKSEKFYLAQTKSTNSLALYWQNYRQRDSKLSSNVEALSVFCVLKKSNSIVIKSASQVNDWSKVKAVFIDLLLRSNKSVFDKPHYYYYLHQRYLASDKHLYKQFGFLVLLRERVNE